MVSAGLKSTEKHFTLSFNPVFFKLLIIKSFEILPKRTVILYFQILPKHTA